MRAWIGTGLKWISLAIVSLIILVGMAACTQLGLNYASLEVDNKAEAYPPLTLEKAEFLAADPEDARQDIEAHIFGPVPTGLSSRVLSHRVVNPDYAEGRGSLEEYQIEISDGDAAVVFYLAVAFPKQADGPVPVIINQTFSTNRMAFGTNALAGTMADDGGPTGDDSERGGFLMAVAKTIFGEFIATAPADQILDAGYAFANFYASDIMPDSARAAQSVLAAFPEGERGRPTGTVAAWISGYSAAIDVLDADPRIDPAKTAVMGHSRHGKSALVAGAFEPRIEAVISHQPGTGGAALSRNKPGETVASITRSYPHWFDPAYAEFDALGPNTTPTDLHMLIALNAPKKVLIGNGRRDVWSDPNGSFRAAQAASVMWKAVGHTGLDQAGMKDLNLSADLIFYMRPGGHGVDQRDWTTFLGFLDEAF